ncbi:hypothetical protein DOTSEDRAFT_169139 [Dothistroma septosporum NZE10]|uniref:Uncharacterized protein n=1 Tax=Dothistroma septosporum (strain NZE10 / CBS 128990) TaxID=675120 RepID=N1PVW3_DOTSN|nr:hypothetical protein DOTSEDRAFT_169139 [Dothistroma septosporum NZE10]
MRETRTITASSESTQFRKTIVMGKLSSQDTDWVQEIMQDWDHAVYYVDLAGNEHSPSGLRTKINKAKEATPYLTYIVEHYDNLPDVAVFLHAHRKGWPEAWHNDAKDYDAVNMLHELQLDVVMERGYVNLRCLSTPGCPNEVQLNRNPPEDDRRAELAYPYVYGQFFNMTAEKVKEQISVIATPCCAQFAVSRDQIHQRPRSEYARYLTLIEESSYDDETLGTVMEYMWHILFGRDAVYCEDTAQCWASVYGRRNGRSAWT